MYAINGSLTKTHVPLTEKQENFLRELMREKFFSLDIFQKNRIVSAITDKEYDAGAQCMFNALRERYIKEKKLNE